MKPKTILFITSFIPVVVFKVVTRVGEATLTQTKVATAVGLILARIQFIKNRAKYPTWKGGDQSPRAEGTENMI